MPCDAAEDWLAVAPAAEYAAVVSEQVVDYALALECGPALDSDAKIGLAFHVVARESAR